MELKMKIINKLKTAKMVLFEYGIKEVLGLLCDNIEKVFIRLYSWLNSFFYRVIYKTILSKLKIKKNEKLKILYVTNHEQSEHGQTIRYRIYNLMEALKGKAEARLEIVENGIYKDENSIKQADIIILMRIMWTEKIEKLISIAKKNAVPIVYDIDDLIFLPEYATHFCNVINEQKKTAEYTKEFRNYEKVFQSCDYATTSTHFIAEQMRKANKTAFIINNGLNYKQLRIADNINIACNVNITRNVKKSQDDLLYICYLSGSKTHDRDFTTAAPALARIVKEYSNVRIRIVGYLDTTGLPEELLKKVTVMCYMSWKRLLRVSARNYINIAPLDIQNPFCHAKSELKFYEAAIVGVPSICSKTDTFNRCIRHGINGMLAETDEEWYNAFKSLIDDRAIYNAIAQNGYEYVKQHYTPPIIAEMALSIYKSIIEQYKKVKG
jgi:glycosyltransferase involved in cell wall biosynthesis